MNGKPDPDEDPFEYVEENLIVAKDAVSDAETSLDVGPVSGEIGVERDTVDSTASDLEYLAEELRGVSSVLRDAERLADGADEAYEHIQEATDFIDHAKSGVYALEDEQSIPAGQIKVANVEYDVYLKPVVDDD